MIETTRITIENMDGEKIELMLEEAKALQRELNEMFKIDNEVTYTSLYPYGEPLIPILPFPICPSLRRDWGDIFQLKYGEQHVEEAVGIDDEIYRG